MEISSFIRYTSSIGYWWRTSLQRWFFRQMNVKKAKLFEIDFVRGIAILAVLLIHGTSEGIAELTEGSIANTIYFTLNKLSHFTVPVFVFVSGVVLFYQYHDRWDGKQALLFYRKRITGVLVPYLLWSFFYYIYPQLLNNPNAVVIDFPELLEDLKWADTGYHLYFLIIILQFYLLFPVLMTIVKKAPWTGRKLIWIGIAVHAGFYILNHWFVSFEHKPSLAVNYFSLFALGGWIGMNYEAFCSWMKKRAAWVIVCGGICGITFAGMYLLDKQGISFENTWFEISVNAYSMAMGMALIWLGQKAVARGGLWNRWLSAIGKASFGIYLMHPAFLTYWRNFVHYPYFPGTYHVYTASSIAWGLFGSWVLFLLYGLFKKGNAAPAAKERNLSAAG